MKSLTLLVLAALLAVALGAGQYYVPRSYYVIDEEGHQSAPISLRRLRRSIFPGLNYGGATASANANANANADGRGSANANAIANANANAHAGGPIFRPGDIGGGGGGGYPGPGGGGGGGIGVYPPFYPGGPGGSTGSGNNCFINCYVYPGSQVGSPNPNGRNNCCYIQPGLQVGSANPYGGLGGMLVSRRSGTVSGASSVSAGSSVDVDGSGISRYDQYTAVGN